MEKLLAILEDICPDTTFEGRDDLVTSGELKSFDIMMLITEISDEFGVDIPVEEVVPENFESVESIMALINSLR